MVSVFFAHRRGDVLETTLLPTERATEGDASVIINASVLSDSLTKNLKSKGVN